jgi:hypothetical protein
MERQELFGVRVRVDRDGPKHLIGQTGVVVQDDDSPDSRLVMVLMDEPDWKGNPRRAMVFPGSLVPADAPETWLERRDREWENRYSDHSEG